MRLNNILDLVSSYAPDADLDIVMRAYVFAAKSHAGQTRNSGEPYLVHPLAVAGILAQLKMDVDTIATALLHDTVEDTLATRQDLSAMFGKEIAELVDGVTKIGKLRFRSKQEAQAENFRKMVLAMSRDIRVILVKLADRLHNMRTLEHMPAHKQQRIAQETLDIHAPIANRLGLGKIKEQLEDLCFRYIHPEAYKELQEAVDADRETRDAYIERTAADLHAHLAARNLQVEVQGRAKSLYSIYRKMVQQRLEFEQVHDLLAFRIFVDSVPLCYEVLGHVHGAYCPVPGKIKDYIAMPKSNGYQSLHTTVFGPENQRIEVQIRTWDMHEVAENGIASHWEYKEGHLDLDQKDIHRIAQLRELFESAREVEDSAEFIQTVKVDLFTHEVYVFTPQRDVVVMSRGATALDFAYKIHTEVGNTCIGAKVNGRIIPLRYELRSGDTVEILTRKNQKPNRDWLQIARTGHALAKIRRELRRQERERGLSMGRDMLDNELRKHGRSLSRLTRAGNLEAVARNHGYKDPEGLLLAVGRGQVGMLKVARDLAPDVEWDKPKEDKKTTALSSIMNRIRRRSESAVLISGEEDVLVNYARCCRPLPGEEVSGYITQGRGITVHRAGCPQLLAHDPDRRIPVQWDSRIRAVHGIELRVVCSDRRGILAEVAHCCEELDINIAQLEARPIEDGKGIINCEVLVHDIRELKRLTRNVERIRGVIAVSRLDH